MELSEAQRQLLKKLLEEEGIDSPADQESIPRRGPVAKLPLSFAQQRLWLLEQLQPGTPVYNVARLIRLSGSLNVAALEKGLNEIVRRHEVLRTVFVVRNGQPQQIVHDELRVPLSVVDSAGLTETEGQARSDHFVSGEMLRPFDLGTAPLLRFYLLRLSATEHRLLVVLHHIISDGWSMGLFWRELSFLYQAHAAGAETRLSELPIQYADYAIWQRGKLQGAVLEEQLGYWKEQLAGLPPLLQLPIAKPRPAVQSNRGANVDFRMSREDAEKLRELSRRAGVTPFMILLATFQVLLSRYSGLGDIAVGTPIAGRTRREVENLIGFFVNTLVMRVEVRDDESFIKLLERVRNVCLGAFGHQELPFEKLVEELQPERSLSYAPLCQVMFSLINYPREELQLPALSLSTVDLTSVTTKFDLMLGTMDQEDKGLKCAFQYSTDLFDHESISRMAGHLQVLLRGILDQPERELWQQPWLSQAERQQLLADWNDTARAYPDGETLSGMFEAQVERTPDSIALTAAENALSYRDLNRRANQLAHYLRSLGVGSEQLVGVLQERSIEMVVSLLAVLKAGAAYVPLDAAYPVERLRYMLGQGHVKLVLTQRDLADRFAGLEVQAVTLEDEQARIDSCEDVNLDSGTASKNLAYVIYTSGSTGRPKGVCIEHRSAAVMLHWARELFSADDLAGVLASTSICFDLSVFELFAPLCWGGTAIVAENALLLPTLERANDVRLINTVPSVMTELLRSGAIPSSLRTVNLAGEALSKTLAQGVYRQTNAQRVYNLYGPSEDTTYSTFALVPKESSEAPSIGRPIVDTQVYLLNERMEPVPVGLGGEIYLGGAGLARGYLHAPALTAERFVPDPFGKGAGARLYRTGDLARYRADGQIEYLGRLDHQVKLRGFRIELGEIEESLRQHPATRETVVLLREDIPDDKRLVAYLILEELISDAELRDFLKDKLPAYMIPSAFILLPEWPLTPNGKLNRAALPSPSSVRAEPVIDEEPETALEQVLANLFMGLLRVDRVGLRDNFFALGGHSLSAMQLVGRVREVLQVELPLRSLFESPTVGELARAVIANEAKEGQTEKVARIWMRVQAISAEEPH
jgi:amino acid adenylation domain-containing protein